jgi:hypothetical protein
MNTNILEFYSSWATQFMNTNDSSGVARGRAIGQLPNDSKVIAQGFFWNATNCPMPKSLDTHVCSKIQVVLL